MNYTNLNNLTQCEGTLNAVLQLRSCVIEIEVLIGP